MDKVLIRKHRPFHPWIFSNELKEVRTDIEPGSAVEVYKGNRLIGSGFYNPHSLITIRMYADTAIDFDDRFILQTLKRAYVYRTETLPHNSFRMVFSESDGLPGLVVDKYAKGFVIQIHAYGIERYKSVMLDALMEFEPDFIFEKSDFYLQKLEGLNNEQKFLYGKDKGLVEIQQDDLNFAVDVVRGQKTGYFFDLLDIRRYVRSISKGKKVLDLFTYSGSFAIYAAQAGAECVIGIDSSEDALALAHENTRRNKCEHISFENADVFDFLSCQEKKYDLIILDPPSFTRSKKKVREALRGYKDINLRSMRCLNPGGMLVTTCCSYHVSDDAFYDILQKAAQDAGRSMRVIGQIGQSIDHPILLAMPESRYLKCYMLQAQ